MADKDEDDLDAFFDEVAAVEAEVSVEEPPVKKQKTLRPKGIVVASSGSATTTTTTTTLQQNDSHTEDSVVPVAPFMCIVPPAPSFIPPPPTLPPPPPPPPLEPKHAHKRAAAGTSWTDATLADWPENDYRIFVGNLSKDVTDPELYNHFSKYKSLAMVKIVKDAKTGLSKGFGFCSLLDPLECAKAIREMDQTWLSSRPIRIKRSDWKDRELKEVRKKEAMKKKQSKRFM